jgi:fido (protein-threonine AMPylation protein)
MFCLPQYIQPSAAAILNNLREEGFLHGMNRDAFTWRLAHYFGEVNALHPFREGNGRTHRAFFGQLARDAGYTLTWQHLNPARNIEASAASLRGDPEPLRKMLDALVTDGISRSSPGLEKALCLRTLRDGHDSCECVMCRERRCAARIRWDRRGSVDRV